MTHFINNTLNFKDRNKECLFSRYLPGQQYLYNRFYHINIDMQNTCSTHDLYVCVNLSLLLKRLRVLSNHKKFYTSSQLFILSSLDLFLYENKFHKPYECIYYECHSHYCLKYHKIFYKRQYHFLFCGKCHGLLGSYSTYYKGECK